MRFWIAEDPQPMCQFRDRDLGLARQGIIRAHANYVRISRYFKHRPICTVHGHWQERPIKGSLLQALKDVRRIATRMMDWTIWEETRIRVAKIFKKVRVNERRKAESEGRKFSFGNGASYRNHLCPRQ